MALSGDLNLTDASPSPSLEEVAPAPSPEEVAPALSLEERVRLMAVECGLTEREGEVLSALVLTEDKNQQIADALGISRRTLQTHISRIYQKTNVETRAGLVMRANGEAQSR